MPPIAILIATGLLLWAALVFLMLAFATAEPLYLAMCALCVLVFLVSGLIGLIREWF